MPRATFMSDEGNRARVLENLTNISDEALSAMDQNFQEFMSHRREYMTLEQIAEMDRVVNRLRTSAARSNMTDEQRAAYNARHRELQADARAQMSDEQRASQNEVRRERSSQLRGSMTPAERAAANAAEAQRVSEHRANMTEEERAAQRDREREREPVSLLFDRGSRRVSGRLLHAPFLKIYLNRLYWDHVIFSVNMGVALLDSKRN